MFVFFLIRTIDIAVLANGGNGIVDRFYPKFWI